MTIKQKIINQLIKLDNLLQASPFDIKRGFRCFQFDYKEKSYLFSSEYNKIRHYNKELEKRMKELNTILKGNDRLSPSHIRFGEEGKMGLLGIDCYTEPTYISKFHKPIKNNKELKKLQKQLKNLSTNK